MRAKPPPPPCRAGCLSAHMRRRAHARRRSGGGINRYESGCLFRCGIRSLHFQTFPPSLSLSVQIRSLALTLSGKSSLLFLPERSRSQRESAPLQGVLSLNTGGIGSLRAFFLLLRWLRAWSAAGAAAGVVEPRARACRGPAHMDVVENSHRAPLLLPDADVGGDIITPGRRRRRETCLSLHRR